MNFGELVLDSCHWWCCRVDIEDWFCVNDVFLVWVYGCLDSVGRSCCHRWCWIGNKWDLCTPSCVCRVEVREIWSEEGGRWRVRSWWCRILRCTYSYYAELDHIYEMFDLLLGFLNLLVLDGSGHFAFVSETLEDRVESHLLFGHFHLQIALDWWRHFAEGSFGAFASLVAVQGLLPLL